MNKNPQYNQQVVPEDYKSEVDNPSEEATSESSQIKE